MTVGRRLVSIRRRIEPDSRLEYDRLWRELEQAVSERKNHAWRFSAAADADLHIEFLEFSSESDPRRDPRVAALLRELDAVRAGTAEEWVS